MKKVGKTIAPVSETKIRCPPNDKLIREKMTDIIIQKAMDTRLKIIFAFLDNNENDLFINHKHNINIAKETVKQTIPIKR